MLALDHQTNPREPPPLLITFQVDVKRSSGKDSQLQLFVSVFRREVGTQWDRKKIRGKRREREQREKEGRTDSLPAEPLHADGVVSHFQSHTPVALHAVTALSVCRALPQARYRGLFLPSTLRSLGWVVTIESQKAISKRSAWNQKGIQFKNIIRLKNRYNL